MKVADLLPGDVVVTGPGQDDRRIVTRVIDADGARGGIVDTMPEWGVYNPDNGFRLGDEILYVVRDDSRFEIEA